ncbi:enoyl-CoA hydratase [Sphingomonas sp. Leaf33]|uniref:enoyl-CoA hydratase/isomerase family protein n=1 Tax=Sphingomonas sp. Leaf33 TaxID=1736215 RepID=UPI0006F46AC7|nr:enoyl-CoA hydratase/isomerase family protein [Sphingomonas sp. Leaf33]KQN26945.1 enoyl-CoA hydratase [Sphingomonas sp. Leaf33]
MIRTRRDGSILRIAFARAEARNAIDAAGWDSFADAIDQAAGGDAAIILLASDVPGVFSAGADLSMLAALSDDPDARVAFRQRMARAVEGLAALPMPVVAAVDGPCYGASVALVLAADIVVAGASASFAVTPAKLGIGYPAADVARLVDRIGRGQASRMLFTAAPVDADEAVRIGLADMRADSAQAAAMAMADTIAGNAAGAVRLLKRTIAGGEDGDAGFDAAFAGTDFATRLAAFRARAR